MDHPGPLILASAVLVLFSARAAGWETEIGAAELPGDEPWCG